MDDAFDTQSLRPQVPVLGALLGNWRLDALVGYGGMGVVYRASDTLTGLPAALKVLMEGACSQTEGLKRFRREVQSLARIQSRGVVRVLEEALDHDPPYFCMELLTGGSLAARIEAAQAAGTGGLPADSLLALAEDLCEGLAAVHAERVLHRDLKPANILFSDDGQAKLADFGMAKQLDMTGLTAANQIMGTLPYMAPETLRGEDADQRTDLYQLGITLFEAATGRKPYAGDVLMPLAAGHTLPPLPRLSALRPELPRVLETFLDGLSAGVRDQRFQSAREAAQFLAESRARGGADPGLPSSRRSLSSGRSKLQREGSSGDLSASTARLGSSAPTARRGPSGSGPARPRLQASRPGPPASDPARSPARLVAGAVALLAVLAGLGWGLFALTHRAPEDRGSRASGTLDLSSAVGRAVDTAVSDDPLRELARLLAAETRAGAAVERLTAGEDDATTQFGAEVFVLDPQTCQRPRLTIRPVGEKAPGIDGHVRVSLDTGAESPPELPLVGETLATGLAEWSVPVPARMLSEGWNRYRIELPVRPGKLSLSVTLEFSRPNGFPGPAPDWQKQRQEGDCPPASKLESAWVVYRDSRLLGAVKVMRELVRQHPFCTDAWFQYLKILLGTLHIREQFGKEAAVSIVSSFWEDELVRTPVPSLRREVRECFNRANRVRPGWAELWNMVGDWSRSLGAHDVALRMGRWTVLAAPRNAEAWFNLARAEDRMLPEVKFGALPQRDRPRAKVVLGHVEKALALAPAGSPLLPRVQALRAKLLVDVGLDHQARAAYAQLETTDRAEARRGLQRLGASTTFSGETSAPAEEPDVSPAPEASPDSDGAEGPTTSVEPAGPGPSSRVVPELTPLKRALADERRLEAAVVAAASPGSGAFQASVFLLDAGSVARAGLEVVAPDRGGASLRLALETRPGGDRGGPAQLPDQPETSPGRWNVPVPPRMLTQGFNRFTLTFAGQAGAALPRAALELERGEGFPEQALPREAPPLGGRCPPEPEQLERVWLMFRNEHGYAGLKYLRQLLTTYPACAEAHLTEARLLFQLALVREQLTQSGFGVLIGDFWEPEMLSATGWTLRHEAQDCFNRLDELFPGWALAWTAYAAWARELGDWDVAVRMARWAVLLRTEDVEAWLGLAAAEAGAVIAAGNAGSAGARAAAGLAMDHLGQALVLAGRDEATLARLELVRGTILKARGDVEQARAVFLRLATKLPDDAKRELTKLDAATKGAPTGP